MRAVMLMAIANQTQALLVATGNKSELACGYTTLYGDSCGGFAPLKDLYKTEVYRLAEWRNRNLPKGSLCGVLDPIPQGCLDRAPSAELAPGQKDSDDLPDYETLDRVLVQLIENDDMPRHDLAGEIWTRLREAEFKRQQGPIGPKISNRDLHRDRRYPLVNGFRPFPRGCGT